MFFLSFFASANKNIVIYTVDAYFSLIFLFAYYEDQIRKLGSH